MLNLNDAQLLKSHSFVDGKWLQPDHENVVEVLNPASGERVVAVSDSDTAVIESAIKAAHSAMHSWSACTAKERSAILRTWFNLIVENREDLALIMTAEQGKPLLEARGEITYAASYIEWFAEEAKRICGDLIPSPSANKRILTMKQPVGVVAAITPWNFPAAMLTRKVAPALAAGCGVVVKPASETPLSALALAELAQRAGVPDGILNMVVTSDSVAAGEILSRHPLVRKLTFTGSTRVGKLLMEQCASTVKKTSMELGGNAPFIVFDDADLDAAINGVIASKFRNAGQTCVCANRILVQNGIYGEFLDRLIKAVKKLRVGEGTDPQATIGPLIDCKALHNVASLVEDAIAKGGKAQIGGQPSVLGRSFYEPTILVNLTRDMRVFNEEIFGPVVPVFRFETEQEALDMANDTDSGLASYVYTENLGRIWRVSEQLDFGMVGANEGNISTEVAPFGGVKESGIGREGSKYGIEDYLELKYVCLGGMAAND